jgi:cytochrome c oxidase cbb3-type subunit III
MRKFIPVIALLGICIVILISGRYEFGAPAPTRGRRLFEANCARCHGPEGKGFPGHTPDFTSPKWQGMHSDRQIVAVITNGVKGTRMPAWKGKLSPAQIRVLTHYIRSLNSANR